MINLRESAMKDRTSTKESLICLAAIILFFGVFASKMGLANTMNTMMNTAYDILIGTAFYVMAMAVMAGAFSGLLTEFGVVELFNRMLSVLMKPLYDLPGAAALGVITTYLSDNPAILALAEDRQFRCSFREYQIPALTNLGTSFGMGLIVTAFMLGMNGYAGDSVVTAVLCGNLGAIAGSIVSTRLMIHSTKKRLSHSYIENSPVSEEKSAETEVSRKKGLGLRVLNAALGGGQNGVQMGIGIIPGVVIICTIVMMLTYGVPDGGYTGAAYEGIRFLPWVGEKLSFLLTPLFGFTDPSCISVPVTALGSAGAAIGLVPSLLKNGLASSGDVAVFTAMCMCWSGYLSTHVSMMEVLGYPQFTGKAVLSHTIGGLTAGFTAHWLYVLISLF